MTVIHHQQTQEQRDTMSNLKKMTRRDFIKASVHTGLLLAAGRGVITGGDTSWAAIESSPAPDLVVVTGSPEKAVARAIELLGGMNRFVKQGQRVVIKPNMSFAKTPDEAANTSPAVVAAVAQSCVAAGAKDVLIVDHTLQKDTLCLELSGIAKSCSSLERTHVLALNDERFYQSVPVPGGKALTTVKVMKEVMECDVLINLPAAKSHSATGVSFGMKGLMGVIWDRGYFHSRVDLHQAIADLCSVIKPHLILLDASRALLTGGPSGPGTITTLNTIVAGTDQVAVDAYGTQLAPWYNKQFEPKHIKHIMAGEQMGLGTARLDGLRIARVQV
jgi:uncharacterized protein (DUF362 family)